MTPRIVISFTRSLNDAFISFCRAVLVNLSEDPLFASVTPPAAVITTNVNTLETLVAESESGDRDAINSRNLQRETCNDLMVQLSASILSICLNAGGTDEEIISRIESTGMKVAVKPTPIGTLPKPLPPRTAISGNVGQINLDWSNLRGAHAWIVQTVPGTDVSPNANWQYLTTTTRTKFEATGLSAGYHSFRLVALGASGNSEASNGVTELAR